MSGRFVDLGLAWHDTSVTHCEVCGRLIPRRAFLFDGGAGELRACGPSCEELYVRYLRPTYGVRRPDAHH